MRQAEEYIVLALEAAQGCATIPQAADAGAQLGKVVAADVLARVVGIDHLGDAYRFLLEDAFQHAMIAAPAQGINQVFLDAALSALTDKLQGQTP